MNFMVTVVSPSQHIAKRSMVSFLEKWLNRYSGAAKGVLSLIGGPISSSRESSLPLNDLVDASGWDTNRHCQLVLSHCE